MKAGAAPRGEPTFLTAARRDADLEAPAGGQTVDVLVVGGGVTGAGLCPLIDDGHGATSDISRSHAVLENPDSGVVTVVGGKLTTYRQMAQDAVDVIAALAQDRPELLEPVGDGVPILGVEVLAAIEREGALTLEDVLERRTRSTFAAGWPEAVAAVAEGLVPQLAAA